MKFRKYTSDPTSQLGTEWGVPRHTRHRTDTETTVARAHTSTSSPRPALTAARGRGQARLRHVANIDDLSDLRRVVTRPAVLIAGLGVGVGPGGPEALPVGPQGEEGGPTGVTDIRVVARHTRRHGTVGAAGGDADAECDVGPGVVGVDVGIHGVPGGVE